MVISISIQMKTVDKPQQRILFEIDAWRTWC